MRFDDRLQTLLEAPVADSRDRAVRWRQLVDLLSRLDAGKGGATVDAALDLVNGDQKEVAGYWLTYLASRP